MQIVMLLSNPFRPDPRVLKEAQSLAEAGFSITIICWDRQAELPPNETIPSGVQIVRIQNVKSSYGIGARQILTIPRFWRSALDLINRLKPDLVHCHDFDTLPAGLFWGKLHHIPVIYDAHEYYADLVRPRLTGLVGKALYIAISSAEKYAASKADAVITVDEILGAVYRRRNHRVLVIGHYPQRSMAEQVNPIFSHSELTLLYAGRISTDRGALLYIDILRCLRNLGVPARLIFAGVITPTSQEHLIKQHMGGVEKYIENLGWIPYQQIQDVYHSADIGLTILQPESRYIAALPVKLFEYMANGLPVIASNFPLITSVVNEAHCGVLVDPLSQPDEIARIIERWWNEPATPRLLGENGRQSVLSKYNWEILGKKLSDLYIQLADK
jgi:glycosyltransferase involved in cell wall biosynthesis